MKEFFAKENLKKSLIIGATLLCTGCRNTPSNPPSSTFRDPEPQVEITAAEPDTSCKNLKKLPANYEAGNFDICVHGNTTYNATDVKSKKNPGKGKIEDARIFVEENGYLGLQSCNKCTIVNLGKVGVQNLTNSQVITTSTDPTDIYVRNQTNTRIELRKE